MAKKSKQVTPGAFTSSGAFAHYLPRLAVLQQKGGQLQTEAFGEHGHLIPVGLETAKQKPCAATKFGNEPVCKVQTTVQDGKMAIRLCGKTNEPGVVVTTATVGDMQRVSTGYCNCHAEGAGVLPNVPEGCKCKCKHPGTPEEVTKKCLRKVLGKG